jgi:hypothetical protein
MNVKSRDRFAESLLIGPKPRTLRRTTSRTSSGSSLRLEQRASSEAELRTRLELTERTESSLREDLERVREERRRYQEEAERLRDELEAERSKGFWRRLFGG